MKVLIRADASPRIGMGHIMRDLVLAQRAFSNAEVVFACRRIPPALAHKLHAAGHRLIRLSGDDPVELADVIRDRGVEVLVIDHYGLDRRFERAVKARTGVRLWVLDDTYTRHHCDVLVNPNLYAEAARYRREGLVPPECELRCGPPHLLIRDEFLRPPGRSPRTPPRRVLVCLGGTDPRNLTPRVIRLLARWTALRVDAVTTSVNARLATLSAEAARHPRVRLHVDTDRLAALIEACDFAIITPSVVVHEVMAMGRPFFAIQTADNQSAMRDCLVRRGVAVLPAPFSALSFLQALTRVSRRSLSGCCRGKVAVV